MALQDDALILRACRLQGLGCTPMTGKTALQRKRMGLKFSSPPVGLVFHAETFHNKKFLKVSMQERFHQIWGFGPGWKGAPPEEAVSPNPIRGIPSTAGPPEGLPWGQHLFLLFSECLPLGPDPSHGHIHGLYPLPSLKQHPPAPLHRGVKLPKGVMRTPAEPPPSGWLLVPQPPWKGAQSPTCHGSWPRPGLLWGHVGWCLSTSPGGLLSSFPG